MTSSEIILEIIAYAKEQGVDFETALKMFQMMYDAGNGWTYTL